jgi:ABC-2 type transport system permease protein
MAAVYGVAMTIGGERWTRTLSALLATPANRFALFLGRALPQIVNGFVVSAFGFFVGWALLDFDPPGSSLGPLALIVLLSTASCTAFGLVIGALGLRLRDPFVVSNPAYFLMLLFCGVNIPLSALPSWIEAAREVAAGASLSSVGGLLWKEALIGACYAIAAYLLLRLFEVEGRRRASLEYA